MNECVHYWLFSAALSCGGKKTSPVATLYETQNYNLQR